MEAVQDVSTPPPTSLPPTSAHMLTVNSSPKDCSNVSVVVLLTLRAFV